MSGYASAICSSLSRQLSNSLLVLHVAVSVQLTFCKEQVLKARHTLIAKAVAA